MIVYASPQLVFVGFMGLKVVLGALFSFFFIFLTMLSIESGFKSIGRSYVLNIFQLFCEMLF